MKKQLIIALLATALLSPQLALAIFENTRSTVVNDSSRGVVFTWGGLQRKTKRCYYHLKPGGDQFTTSHFTSDKIYYKYPICENGRASEKEGEFESRFRAGTIHFVDDGNEIKVEEIEAEKK